MSELPACTCVENVQRYAAYEDLVMRDCPAHPYYRTPCTATFEPVARKDRPGTHTCTLGGGHDGPHFCATCRSEWEAPDPVCTSSA
jgi:hypothetical protein